MPDFVELLFTPLVGGLKCVEVSGDEYEKATLSGKGIDGSSVRLAPIERSDLLLRPVEDSYFKVPEEDASGKALCDIYAPAERVEDFGKEKEYHLSPRTILKKVLRAREEELGCRFVASLEMEFFLLKDGEFLDRTGYFAPQPRDRSIDLRHEILRNIGKAGVAWTYTHHEVSTGQYEVCLHHELALKMADNATKFRYIAKNTAHRRGLNLTFMPKPFPEINGSGMHIHMSLMKEKDNLFYGGDTERISPLAKHFVGGILQHAEALAAFLASSVNSYKRLVPGYEAPINLTWGHMNRSALIRVPTFNDAGAARLEIRAPDPFTNPYLALAALLAAGFHGIQEEIDPGDPCAVNTYVDGEYETLPSDLGEALEALSQDTVLKEALGREAVERYRRMKMAEWEEYREAHEVWDPSSITQWERDRYIDYF